MKNKTSIQITTELKKKLKIICAKKEMTYEKFIESIIQKENYK